MVRVPNDSLSKPLDRLLSWTIIERLLQRWRAEKSTTDRSLDHVVCPVFVDFAGLHSINKYDSG